MNIVFEDATRMQSKASIVIQGLSGSGKTGLALQFARALADWNDIFCLDTENRSMNLFQGIKLCGGEPVGKFKKFDLTEADGFAPSNYIEIRNAACEAGAKVFVQDSTTQAWTGRGGVLDIVSAKSEAANSKSVSVWNDTDVQSEKLLLNTPMWRDNEVHVISTVRTKEKIGFTEDNKVIKLPESPIMQDQVKYEPDLIITMIKAGTPDGEPPRGVVEKSRYAIFKVNEEYEFTPELCSQLADYLDEGEDPEVLLAKQKDNMVQVITDMLNKDKTLAIRLKMFKKNNQLDESCKLADMDINQLNKLYKLLYN